MNTLLILTRSLFVAILAVTTCTTIAHSQPKLQLPDTPYDYQVVLPVHLRNNNISARKSNPRLNDIATLGRVLFFDNTLSANNLVSCASCHKQVNGFDDPTRFSIGFKGKITSRNAMGLTNARFNANGRYFWDERATSLNDQVLQPFFDDIEMGIKSGKLVERIANKVYYDKLFRIAFDSPIITEAAIASALTGFINAIVSTNSAYDTGRAAISDVLHDFPNFTTQQNLGKRLFFTSADKGGAGCSTCHQTDNFIAPKNGANNGLDLDTSKDEGIGKISGNTNDNGKFRPPSLRNIAVRAPYMHDGRFLTLAAVINHYSTSIQSHPNLDKALKNLDGSPRRFNFSQDDRNALIAFLETLNDTVLLNDPKFSNPFQ